MLTPSGPNAYSSIYHYLVALFFSQLAPKIFLWIAPRDYYIPATVRKTCASYFYGKGFKCIWPPFKHDFPSKYRIFYFHHVLNPGIFSLKIRLDITSAIFGTQVVLNLMSYAPPPFLIFEVGSEIPLTGNECKFILFSLYKCVIPDVWLLHLLKHISCT